jgi:hypothetical protein
MSASNLISSLLFRVRTLILEKSQVDFLRATLYNEAVWQTAWPSSKQKLGVRWRSKITVSTQWVLIYTYCVSTFHEAGYSSLGGRRRNHGFLDFKLSPCFVMLYVFFWVIPWRLNFICRRFGTLSVSYLQASRCTSLPVNMEQSVSKRRNTKFRRRGITQKKTYKQSWFDSQPVLVFSQFQSPERLWVPQMVNLNPGNDKWYFAFSQVLWLALGPSQLLI